MLYLLQHIIEPIKEYKPMKKKQFFYTFAAGIFAAAILAGGLVSSPTLVSADEEPTAEATDASNNPQDNNASQLQTLLENEGFYVQQGSFYELDTLKVLPQAVFSAVSATMQVPPTWSSIFLPPRNRTMPREIQTTTGRTRQPLSMMIQM